MPDKLHFMSVWKVSAIILIFLALCTVLITYNLLGTTIILRPYFEIIIYFMTVYTYNEFVMSILSFLVLIGWEHTFIQTFINIDGITRSAFFFTYFHNTTVLCRSLAYLYRLPMQQICVNLASSIRVV